jgi:AraC-like DNA-binding protein
MDTTFRNDIECPLGSAVTAPPEASHDLRPALRLWSGVWRLAPGEYRSSTGDMAFALVHLGGAELHARYGDSIAEDKVLEEGSVLTVKAQTPFRLRADGEVRVLAVIFDEALIRISPIPVFGRAAGHYDLQSTVEPPPSLLADLGVLLARELSDASTGRSGPRAALMVTVIEAIAGTPSMAKRSAGGTLNGESRIQRVIRLVDDNISLPLSLDWLSAEACMSRYHLSRMFRQVTGVNLQHYIRTRRLQVACKLLAETRKPLAEIAYDCGFSGQSRMNAVFRESLAMTPLEYRKQCWKEGDAGSSAAGEAPAMAD